MPRVSSSTTLAIPNGRWIIKTHAYESYKLGPTDFESIRPISIVRANNRDTVKYNRCDVEIIHAKVDEMKKTLQVDVPAGETVPESGDTISRTKAKGDYKLNDHQIDRIRPCFHGPNPNSTKGAMMRKYNVGDVKALVDGIAGLGDMPEPEDVLHEGNNPDAGAYDGMSPDDAEAYIARLF